MINTVQCYSLIKSPLSPSMGDVVDMIDMKSSTEPRDWLVSDCPCIEYDGKNYNFNPNKKVKIVLPSPIESYLYNYMIVETKDEENRYHYYYYFITEQHNNSNAGTTIYTCEWDAWNNNINNFDYNKTAICTRRHVKDFRELSDGTFAPLYYLTDEPEAATEERIIDFSITYNYPDNEGGEYRMLWLRLYFDNEATLTTADGESSPGAYPLMAPFKVVYLPYCYIRPLNRLPALTLMTEFTPSYGNPNNETVPFVYNVLYGAVTTPGYEELYNKLMSLLSSTHLIGGEFTFVSNQSFDATYLGKLTVDGEEYNVITNFTNNRQGHSNYVTKLYTIPTVSGANAANAYKSNGLSFKKEYCGRFYNYPYYYFILYANRQKYNILPHETAESIYFTLDNLNKSAPQINWSTKGFGYNDSWVSLSPVGSIPFAIDSLQEFLRNQGAQFATNSTLSLISNSLNLAFMAKPRFQATGAVSLIGSLVNPIASLWDIERQQDKLNLPTNNAINDLKFQDDVILMRAELVDEHANRLAEYFNSYGIAWNTYHKIFEVTHNNFDYVQSSDVTFPEITDALDRVEIERMFKSGVRIWHKKRANSTAFKTFNRDYCNVPTVIYLGDSEQ